MLGNKDCAPCCCINSIQAKTNQQMNQQVGSQLQGDMNPNSNARQINNLTVAVNVNSNVHRQQCGTPCHIVLMAFFMAVGQILLAAPRMTNLTAKLLICWSICFQADCTAGLIFTEQWCHSCIVAKLQ